MKKYIFLLSVILSFLGCEKEMMDYEGKDGVYFCVQEVPPRESGNLGAYRHDIVAFFYALGERYYGVVESSGDGAGCGK